MATGRAGKNTGRGGVGKTHKIGRRSAAAARARRTAASKVSARTTVAGKNVKTKKKAATKKRKRIRPPAPPATDRIERRRSGIHGWGVFATASIPKNKRVVDYAGEKLRTKDSITRQERQLAKGHIWCFELNRAWVVDAEVGGNVARFINHSCTPNCYVQIDKGIIWIRAARTIARGEEISYDYHTDGDKTMRCRCRPGCERML